MTQAQAALRDAVARLRAADVADPARDARRLLAHALGIPADRVTLALGDALDAGQVARFDDLIDQRARRVPVSQLIGRRAFYGRDFMVSPDVLDPRPETETLIAAALEKPFLRVLDLGTGSGCILLTLLAEGPPDAFGVGTDLSSAALAVALRNAAALGLGDRVSLLEGSWFGALRDRVAGFDLILSNPPYIAAAEMPGLAPEVRDFEPRMALTDEGDGLGAYRAIIAGAGQHLVPGGRLIVEIGPTQAEAVSGMMTDAGLIAVQRRTDFDGRPRVVSAEKPQSGF